MSQNKRIMLNMPGAVLTDLSYWAGQENKPLSVYCRDVVIAKLNQQAAHIGTATLLPQLNAVLDARLGELINKMSHILTRTYLKSATARDLILSSITVGMNSREAAVFNDAAWGRSVKSLHTKTEELSDLSKKLREGLL